MATENKTNPNTKKLADFDNLSSDTDTEMMLHGRQQIEGLEFDDLDAIDRQTNSISLNSSLQATPINNLQSSNNINSSIHSTNVSNNLNISAPSMIAASARDYSYRQTGPTHYDYSGKTPASDTSKSGETTINRHGSFTSFGKESPKIPTLTQVYELASNVGHAIEPLTHELGQNRLEHLTKQLLPVLSLLENTAQTCQDLFRKEQQLLYDNNILQKRLRAQQEHFESSELEYHSTINHLSDQLAIFQSNLDNKSSEWDFDVATVSHVEENLAMALKEAQDKIEQLKALTKNAQNSLKSENQSNNNNNNNNLSNKKYGTTTTSLGQNVSSSIDDPDLIEIQDAATFEEQEQDTQNETNDNAIHPSLTEKYQPQTSVKENEKFKQENLEDLNHLIGQKNYYKEKCFELEDKIRELQGKKHEILIDGPNHNNNHNSNNNNHQISNTSLSSLGAYTVGNINLSNLSAFNLGNISPEKRMPKSVSTFFSRFTNLSRKASSSLGGQIAGSNGQPSPLDGSNSVNSVNNC